ncbi:HNH endonuclease [Crateriforma spongiae]|uniref:HNH endonuclease n=1 Tax=Crateriforma spongiae TaxID=2724528 RepID=UPI0039AEDB36
MPQSNEPNTLQGCLSLPLGFVFLSVIWQMYDHGILLGISECFWWCVSYPVVAILLGLSSAFGVYMLSDKTETVDETIARAQGRLAEMQSNRTESTERYRWPIATRREVWSRCNRRCFYCGRELIDWTGPNMHLDHKAALANGGPDSEENLVASCPECNLEKGAAHYPELH